VSTQELQQNYANRITSILDDMQGAIGDGVITNEEERDTWIHESIDGSDIIYTTHALEVLLCCRNEDAYVDVHGELPGLVRLDGDNYGRVDWTAFAYYAVLEDVQRRLPAWTDPNEVRTIT
jgi:hypothetical protein